MHLTTQNRSLSPTSKQTSTTSSKYLNALRRDGFVVIKNLIPGEQLDSLREASKHITSIARSNGWPHIRSVPKQYPPWPSNSEGINIWGIQHLLHPEMPNRKVFADLYFSDAVLDVVKDLVGEHDNDNVVKVNKNNHDNDNDNDHNNNDHTNSQLSNTDQTSNSTKTPNLRNGETTTAVHDENLVMELFNLLVSPGCSTDFELCWHRDDIKPTTTPSEEQAQLDQKSPQTGPQLHAQYNIALHDDSSLIVIPGSHRRIRTDTERNAAPYQPLPGEVCVALAAGDAVFYDSNILHRGRYQGINETQESGRMTVHGSVGLDGHGNERARQVLQHGVGKWVDRDGDGDGEYGFGLDGRIGDRAERMRKRLIAMGRGEDVGYSLDEKRVI